MHSAAAVMALSSQRLKNEVILARKESLEILGKLNHFLRQKTFLVGERLSLGDIFLCVETLPLLLILRKEVCDLNRDRLPHLFRWINTCCWQTEFQEVLGNFEQLL